MGEPLQTAQLGDALLDQRNASYRWRPEIFSQGFVKVRIRAFSQPLT